MIQIIHDGDASIKVYPVKPNYEEMKKMVDNSNVMPKIIPHLLLDNNCSQIYLSISPFDFDMSATTALAKAMRWVTVFELGLFFMDIKN